VAEDLSGDRYVLYVLCEDPSRKGQAEEQNPSAKLDPESLLKLSAIPL